MIRLPASSRRREAGAVAVMVAILSIVVFGMAAIVVDLGHGREVRRQAQNAVDAASLAGMNVMYAGGATSVGCTAVALGTPDICRAVAAAKAYAATNMGTTLSDTDWANCVDVGRPVAYVPQGGPCLSVDNVTNPTRLRVRLPQIKVQVGLAGIFNVNQLSVSAAAEAGVDNASKVRCGICVVGAGSHAVQNGNVIAHGADVHFNGNVDMKNNGEVTADGGKISVQGNATGPNYSPTPITGYPQMADPLSFLPRPLVPTGSLNNWSAFSPCDKGPGRYGSFSGSRGCVLRPGVYEITGTWSMSGQESMTAAGVTLYFTCGNPASPTPCASTGQDGGSLQATGQGGLDITAPTVPPTKGPAFGRGNPTRT
ncbi:MAG: TadE/TadG family type IV pilus assembly protein, partial [Nocardioidaceae bacterium]